MSKIKKLELKITKENLLSLINTIKDLSNIDDKLVFKFSNDSLLIYSLVGEGQTINAFKSFVFDNSLFMNDIDVEDTIIYIAKSAKLLVKNMRTLIDFDNNIDVTLYYDTLGDKVYADRLQLKSNNKLKLNFYGADPMATNTKVTNVHIRDLGESNEVNFEFDLTEDDFSKVKKLASPDAEMDIFYMNTAERDGVFYVSLGENNWDLELDSVDVGDERSLAFPKKYFKSVIIDKGGSCKVKIYDTFLMVSTDNSDLLISMEVTV